MRNKLFRSIAIVALLLITVLTLRRINNQLTGTDSAEQIVESWTARISTEELEQLETARFGVLDNEQLTLQCRAIIEELGLDLSGPLRRPDGKLVDMLQRREDYLGKQRHFVQEYERLGTDTGAMKAKVAELIDLMMKREASIRPDVTETELAKSFRAAVDAGVKDPFPVAIYTFLNSPGANDRTLGMQLRQYAIEMKDQGYSSNSVQWVAHMALKRQIHIPDGITKEEFVSVFANAFCDYLAEGDGSDKRLANDAEMLINKVDELQLDELLIVYERMLQDKRIHDALVCIFAGELHVKYGWEERTANLASLVREEQWKKFSYHFGRAKMFLKRAWILKPNIPESAIALIPIAMAGEEDFSTRDWFKLATQSGFDHASAYWKFSFSMMPKWGGSEADVYEFARECFKTRAFGTVVPVQCFSAISQLASENPDEKIWESATSQEIVADCADELDSWLDSEESKEVREESLADIKAWLISILMTHKDFERAGRLLRRVRCQPTPGIIKAFMKEPEIVSGRALAFSGPYAESLQAIHDKFVVKAVDPKTTRDEIETAIKVVGQAIAETTYPEEISYLTLVSNLLPAYLEFCCGPARKANIAFDTKLTTWLFENGSGEFVSENQMVIKRLGDMGVNPVRIAFRHRFGPPFRLRATIEIPSNVDLDNLGTRGYPPVIEFEWKQDNGIIQRQNVFLHYPSRQYLLDFEVPVNGHGRLNDSGKFVLKEGEVVPSDEVRPINGKNRFFDGRIWIGVIDGAVIKDVSVEQLSQ